MLAFVMVPGLVTQLREKKKKVYNQQQIRQKNVIQKLQLLTEAEYFPDIFGINHPLQGEMQDSEGVVSCMEEVMKHS